jgi:hypothetical protein
MRLSYKIRLLFISAQYLPHRKCHMSVTKTVQLLLVGEMVVIYSENRMKHVTTLHWKNERICSV